MKKVERSGLRRKKKVKIGWVSFLTRGLVAGNLGADRIVLGFLPFQSNSMRNYRGQQEFQKDEETPEFFTSFFLCDETQSKVYEVGFSLFRLSKVYRWDRTNFYLDCSFNYFAYWFWLSVFFSGALIRPLGNVIEGLKQVNAGNLNVQLSVKVKR